MSGRDGGIGPKGTGESGAKGSHQIEGGRITGGLVGHVGQVGHEGKVRSGVFQLKKKCVTSHRFAAPPNRGRGCDSG